MLLLLFAALGFGLGYWLGIGRRGFVGLAAVSIGTSVFQVGHLLTTTIRTSMTLMPLVVGTIVVVGMLAGALLRSSRASTAA
jgi:hypothetical protein